MKQIEHLDLNLLLLLHWLLEERSVTRAARHMGISQPAASRGLHRLREEFSDELLIRSGRSYTLSRLAHSIQGDLARGMQHLRIVAHSEDDFRPDKSAAKFAIACNDYLTTLCTQAWLANITPHAPALRSNWRPLDLSVKEALASGRIDFAIMPRAAQANIAPTAVLQDMVVKPLVEDKFVVFGPSTHDLFKTEKLSLNNFATAHHVLVSPLGEGLGFVDKTLAEHDLKRRIAHRTAGFNHAADLAILTDSVTVIPERLARLKRDGIYRPLPFQSEALSSDIIWHASRTSDKAHSWVRHQLQIFFKTQALME